jgi:hypothetical protein
MVSAQNPGAEAQFWVKTPSGNQYLLYGNSSAALGPSGSSEGVIASTPEKWLSIPRDNKLIPVNSKIIVKVKLGTADGLDFSDGAMSIPVTTLGGAVKALTNGDFTGTDLAAATPVGIWIEFGYYTVTEPLYFGGGKIFYSVENDA